MHIVVILGTLLGIVALSMQQSCSTNLDCRLNGVCADSTCICDTGWTTGNCGALDIRPGPRANGYNQTGSGISSWGSKPIRDPTNDNLWHAFIAEMANDCTLNGWAPYSSIIRAASSTGPLGPFVKQELIVSPFAHNPTVVWDEASMQYLLHHIGCPQDIGTGCSTYSFQCSQGNDIYGESGVSYRPSTDLYDWPYQGNYVLPGNPSGAWNSDVTNPSAWPLQDNAYNSGGSHRCPGSTTLSTDQGPGIVIAYRGSPYDQSGVEQIGLAVLQKPGGGNITFLNNDQPIFSPQAEDPYIWRDKRGNWHIIMHALSGGFRGAPNVGAHAYAESLDGPWFYDSDTPAFTTTVTFDDGTTIVYGERERPQLVFTDDGNMTPIVLTTGVVEDMNTFASYSLAVPIGDYDVLWNTSECV